MVTASCNHHVGVHNPCGIMNKRLLPGLPFSGLFDAKCIEQAACRVENAIVRQQCIILGSDIAATRLEQFVLGVQYVQQCPLTQPKLLLVRLYGVIAGVNMLFRKVFCLASDSFAFQARRVPSSTWRNAFK